MRAFRRSVVVLVSGVVSAGVMFAADALATPNKGYVYDEVGNIKNVVDLLVDRANCGKVGNVCVAPTPACTGGVCVQCAGSGDCPSTTPVCSNSICVQCGSASDCPVAAPVCRYNQCVECTDGTTCAPPKPYCNSGHWTCESCTLIGCAAGQYCSSSDGMCKQFDSNNCGSEGTVCSAVTPVCRYGACVQCADSGGCAPPTPICNAGLWTCTSCNVLGCGPALYCNSDGSCQSACLGNVKPVTGEGACAGKCLPSTPPNGYGACSSDCDCGNASAAVYCDIRARDCRSTTLSMTIPLPNQRIPTWSPNLIYTPLSGTSATFSFLATGGSRTITISYSWKFTYVSGPTQQAALVRLIIDGFEVANDYSTGGVTYLNYSFVLNSGSHTVSLEALPILVSGPPVDEVFVVGPVSVALGRQ